MLVMFVVSFSDDVVDSSMVLLMNGSCLIVLVIYSVVKLSDSMVWVVWWVLFELRVSRLFYYMFICLMLIVGLFMSIFCVYLFVWGVSSLLLVTRFGLFWSWSVVFG